MSRGHRAGAAAAVSLTAAAALLLTACGSDGGHDRAKDPATASAPSSAAPAAPTASGSADASPGSGAGQPGSAADAPKVPDTQLTPPGGGTFTAQQKKYLSGRVPRGTDPVAVLEGGQEICERLTRTAAIDKDAAATAIVTGDISYDGAAAAVGGLCPDQQGVVDAARRGFADGTYTVGAKTVPGTVVVPGVYRAPHPSASCSWRATGADGSVLASGRGTGADRPAALIVPADARGITSSGCYAWLASPGTRS
ncbi:hypothetical protein [Streptomyces sp. NPDC021224]|uniref:hypothetical protein n=1 Tax=unclassified Streptomyces TaxID=2593676 RepID=UPI00379A3998